MKTQHTSSLRFRDLVESFINAYGSEPSWDKLRMFYLMARYSR